MTKENISRNVEGNSSETVDLKPDIENKCSGCNSREFNDLSPETSQTPEEGTVSEDTPADDGCCSAECMIDEGCEDCSSELEELEKRLKETEEKRDEYLAMAQRVQADFDNFRRRNRNAINDAYKSATADTIENLLPVLDNLERAYSSSVDSGAPESFTKGIDMVIRQFRDCLYKMDVEEIEALNQPFDPELHNAVMQVEAEEGQPENTIVEVLQKGYRMGNKVIRYSMVKVAR